MQNYCTGMLFAHTQLQRLWVACTTSLPWTADPTCCRPRCPSRRWIARDRSRQPSSVSLPGAFCTMWDFWVKNSTFRHCPKLRRLVLVYGHGRREEDHDPGVVRPRAGVVDNAGAGVGHQVSHLAPLANLQGLQNLQVVVRLSIISLNAAFLGSECRVLLAQSVHSGHSGNF